MTHPLNREQIAALLKAEHRQRLDDLHRTPFALGVYTSLAKSYVGAVEDLYLLLDTLLHLRSTELHKRSQLEGLVDRWRKDLADPAEPVDPTGPADPADPAEPVDPAGLQRGYSKVLREHVAAYIKQQIERSTSMWVHDAEAELSRVLSLYQSLGDYQVTENGKVIPGPENRELDVFLRDLESKRTESRLLPPPGQLVEDSGTLGRFMTVTFRDALTALTSGLEALQGLTRAHEYTCTDNKVSWVESLTTSLYETGNKVLQTYAAWVAHPLTTVTGLYLRFPEPDTLRLHKAIDDVVEIVRTLYTSEEKRPVHCGVWRSVITSAVVNLPLIPVLEDVSVSEAEYAGWVKTTREDLSLQLSVPFDSEPVERTLTFLHGSVATLHRLGESTRQTFWRIDLPDDKPFVLFPPVGPVPLETLADTSYSATVGAEDSNVRVGPFRFVLNRFIRERTAILSWSFPALVDVQKSLHETIQATRMGPNSNTLVDETLGSLLLYPSGWLTGVGANDSTTVLLERPVLKEERATPPVIAVSGQRGFLVHKVWVIPRAWTELWSSANEESTLNVLDPLWLDTNRVPQLAAQSARTMQMVQAFLSKSYNPDVPLQEQMQSLSASINPTCLAKDYVARWGGDWDFTADRCRHILKLVREHKEVAAEVLGYIREHTDRSPLPDVWRHFLQRVEQTYLVHDVHDVHDVHESLYCVTVDPVDALWNYVYAYSHLLSSPSRPMDPTVEFKMELLPSLVKEVREFLVKAEGRTAWSKEPEDDDRPLADAIATISHLVPSKDLTLAHPLVLILLQDYAYPSSLCTMLVALHLVGRMLKDDSSVHVDTLQIKLDVDEPLFERLRGVLRGLPRLKQGQYLIAASFWSAYLPDVPGDVNVNGASGVIDHASRVLPTNVLEAARQQWTSLKDNWDMLFVKGYPDLGLLSSRSHGVTSLWVSDKPSSISSILRNDPSARCVVQVQQNLQEVNAHNLDVASNVYLSWDWFYEPEKMVVECHLEDATARWFVGAASLINLVLRSDSTRTCSELVKTLNTSVHARQLLAAYLAYCLAHQLQREPTAHHLVLLATEEEGETELQLVESVLRHILGDWKVTSTLNQGSSLELLCEEDAWGDKHVVLATPSALEANDFALWGVPVQVHELLPVGGGATNIRALSVQRYFTYLPLVQEYAAATPNNLALRLSDAHTVVVGWDGTRTEEAEVNTLVNNDLVLSVLVLRFVHGLLFDKLGEEEAFSNEDAYRRVISDGHQHLWPTLSALSTDDLRLIGGLSPRVSVRLTEDPFECTRSFLENVVTAYLADDCDQDVDKYLLTKVSNCYMTRDQVRDKTVAAAQERSVLGPKFVGWQKKYGCERRQKCQVHTEGRVVHPCTPAKRT